MGHLAHNGTSGVGDRKVDLRCEREDFIRRSREAFMSIVNSVPVHIANVGEDGIYQTWNETSERIFGYNAHNVLGKLPLRHLFVDERDFVFVWNAVRESDSYRGEIRMRRNNGESFAAWLTIVKHFNFDGRFDCYVVTVFDRKEQRNMEQQLQVHIKRLIKLEALMDGEESEQVETGWGANGTSSVHHH